VSFPPATFEPGRTDWRVLAALRRDARRSYAELAGELRLSERTVRRSVERLTEGKVMYLMPRLDMARAEGVVTGSFNVFHRDPAQRGPADAVLRQLPGIAFQWYEGPSSRLSLARRNVAELEAARREIAAVPGVERVVSDITVRRIVVDEWLDDLVARKADGKA
jgi:DNA-binding Lrp family transcriptional regulator